jgi:hypothetical protein
VRSQAGAWERGKDEQDQQDEKRFAEFGIGVFFQFLCLDYRQLLVNYI